MAAPLAVRLLLGSPVKFTEVTNFRGDFDLLVRRGEVVNPKGVAYHAGHRRVLVSLSPATSAYGTRVQTLNLVASDGTRVPFGPTDAGGVLTQYKMYRDVEAMLAVVPAAGPPVQAGFMTGDVFVGRGPGDQVSRLSRTGQVLAEVFADPGTGEGLWGGITFDTTGAFGGALLAVTVNGKVFSISAAGTATLLVDLHRRLEGVAVAPAGFGPLAGQLILGVEGHHDADPESGKVYALSASGALTLLADIGYLAEHLEFIPPTGGTYYQAEISFERERENRLLAISSSQLLGRLGHLIIASEMTGELFEVAWEGDRYTQSRMGRAPGHWPSEGLLVQKTELEGGTVAARPPDPLPAWSPWAAVPGGQLTDRAPAAAVDDAGNLHLLVRDDGSGRAVINSMWGSGPEIRTWIGWGEIPGGLMTDHPMAAALHNRTLYGFAVGAGGRVVHKRLFVGRGSLTAEPWTVVPGDLLTSAPVSATVSNGRLVLGAVGTDQRIYLNELAPGGRTWSEWTETGDGRTAMAPAVVGFDDELWVLAVGLTTRRVLAKVRGVDGAWTGWSEIPVGGTTDRSAAAVVAGGWLHLFVKGIDDRAPYWNVASETGTWTGWRGIANGGRTDAALTAAAIRNTVYLFAKGVDDRQVYMRHTRS